MIAVFFPASTRNPCAERISNFEQLWRIPSPVTGILQSSNLPRCPLPNSHPPCYNKEDLSHSISNRAKFAAMNQCAGKPRENEQLS
jgi:hypothetical protein